MLSYSLLLLAIRSDLTPQVAMPPRDAHVRHLDVSSFLGPASMVERRIGSTTRWRGASGGEFLQQGFAYVQSGGRERGGKQGGVCPQPSLYRGLGGQPLTLPQALGPA